MSFADDQKDKGANVSPTQFETPIQKDKSYEHQGQGSRVADKAKESLLIMQQEPNAYEDQLRALMTNNNSKTRQDGSKLINPYATPARKNNHLSPLI